MIDTINKYTMIHISAAGLYNRDCLNYEVGTGFLYII